MSFETYNKGNNQKNDSVNTRGIQMKNRFKKRNKKLSQFHSL